ncbi:MAG: chemotaxis protein CheW, partial [Promethearchaeota archaeon]
MKQYKKNDEVIIPDEEMHELDLEQDNIFLHRAKTEDKKFVLFTLGNDLFSIPVEQVNQVDNYESFHHTPWTADYVMGITHFLEKIVTLVDLKKRLLIAGEIPKKGKNQIIYVNINDKVIGILVDKVLSLVTIPVENIKEESSELISTYIDPMFSKGTITSEEGIIVILNIEIIISDYEPDERYRKKYEEARKRAQEEAAKKAEARKQAEEEA